MFGQGRPEPQILNPEPQNPKSMSGQGALTEARSATTGPGGLWGLGLGFWRFSYEGHTFISCAYRQGLMGRGSGSGGRILWGIDLWERLVSSLGFCFGFARGCRHRSQDVHVACPVILRVPAVITILKGKLGCC